MAAELEARLAAIERRVDWLIARLAWVEEQVGTKQRTGAAAERSWFDERTRREPPTTLPEPEPEPERARVARVSIATGAEREREEQPRAPASPAPPAPPRPAAPAAARLDFEEVLGGRVLAWVGGIAVVLGVAFFLVMAVRRGWIDEATRVTLAFAGSTVLLGLGLYLYERQGKTQAALAAVATSIAALYASDTAATALYDLVSPAVGLGIAGLIGIAATAIAVRWNSLVVAGIGIVGALLAPALLDAGTTNVALAFMGVALVAAAGVLVWRRWDWLAAAAFVVSVPQLLGWIADAHDERLTLSLVVLSLFWLVYVVAAIGYELRVPTERLRATSASLLLANAMLLAGVGWLTLEDLGRDEAGTAWVIGAGLVHFALGAATLRERISREIALLLLAVAIGLSAIALALALGGPALVAAWSAEAVILAWLARRPGYRRSLIASLVFVGLAAGHVLAFDAPPDVVFEPSDDWGAAIAVALVAAAAFLCARLATDGRVRLALDVVAAAAVAYVVPVALDGVLVVVAWAAASVAAAYAARRAREPLGLAAPVAFLALAASHVLTQEAPPDALRRGVDDLLVAAVAITAVAAAAVATARWLDEERAPYRRALEAAAAVALVYLPSVAIVDLTATGERLEPGQTPQVLLSAFWSVLGLVAIVYGLVRDDVRLRIGGLILLGLAVAKVFLYDLAALDEIFRVLSFIVLGLLLLAGAFAYQRIRRTIADEATE